MGCLPVLAVTLGRRPGPTARAGGFRQARERPGQFTVSVGAILVLGWARRLPAQNAGPAYATLRGQAGARGL